jgi:hypothetical protein
VIEQIDQADVAIEVSHFVPELRHHPAQLNVHGLGDVRHKADNTQRLPLGFTESG